ncbi:isoleucyl-tRNA synthetase [Metamycoplasma subdolum]|uniref:Isoleucine--tRNA ligase n=1 Tax=Metamycoplasma subdolum TaxID=92407 RepID=A0A3M0A3A5_9BACT|nr:isoleucine--tRNA ligase [Metamycoplasma subdolum]RMA79127.1 isoleucyl-tRNA synthetase [Metamycoplasma subdolum]WPB50649.1 isoleucine--tRNA ligase [Metamycoplasma subdolum]
MEENKKDYKNTLLMPQTDFPMKADLATKGEQYVAFWEKNKIYKKLLKRNKNNKPFILHDGPPYANGSIHCGHALNKILKDIIVRFRTMQGYFSPFEAGWDTHGLPIEHKMLSEAKKQAKDYSIVELRKNAEDYALKQIEIQKEQFKKLSLLTDFSKTYITLDKKMEAKQLKLFWKMVKDKLIYKDLKPIYWSPSSQSALAEAEVEYADHISPSVIVAFKVKKGNEIVHKNEFLLIWTTTPWTLLANSAVAVSEKFKYKKISVEGRNFVIASDLLESVKTAAKFENVEIISEFSGKDLLNLEYESPLNKNICPVVLGHHVTLEAGTGLVHIAPLFGEDDFIIGNKYNLKKIMHVEDDGNLNENGLQFKGMFYDDANPLITKLLLEENLLLSFSKIKHQYPHDWRTHKPIMYRATPQWFVSLTSIKKDIIKALKKVKTYNDWSKKRLSLMLENRNTWCISRQRSWGVPITIFYDENKKPVIENEIFKYVIKLVEKEGTNVWYEKDSDSLLPEKFRGLNYTKENDIMDVWFDSGSTSISVTPSGIKAPFDLYLEGSDQYRGWFNSSLINSVVWRGESPFKALLSHGFVLDGKGQKMSKSKGNVVDPLEVVKKYGSDILRLWAANSEYTNDVTIDEKILQQNVEIYRKIRNTIKFMLGGISDFKFKVQKLDSIHALIYERLMNLETNILSYYEQYKFINVIKDINNFIIDLSSYYISITKDILYLNKKDDCERRQVQYIFYQTILVLLKALAPILPTTTEEIYKYFNVENKEISVHFLPFVKNRKLTFIEEEKWKSFFALKDEIYKAIEEQIKAQTIKRSNECFVTVKTDDKFIKSLPLEKLLMVAKVTFGNELKVEKKDSFKCLRCWNHFEEKDFNKDDEICMRCKEVINV